MLTNLNNEIIHFLELVRKQNGVLENLLELEEKKRQVIILGQVEELNKITSKEGMLVSDLEKLEDARFKSQTKLAEIWEIPVKELTADLISVQIKELCPEYDEEYQDAIELIRRRISQLKAINEENSDLLNQSLDYIQSLQYLLTGDVAGTYSVIGEQADESGYRPVMRLLDKKI